MDAVAWVRLRHSNKLSSHLKSVFYTVLHFSSHSASRSPPHPEAFLPPDQWIPPHLATCTSLQSPNAGSNTVDTVSPPPVLHTPSSPPATQGYSTSWRVAETCLEVKHPAVQKGLPKERNYFLPCFRFFGLFTAGDIPESCCCSLVFSSLSTLDGYTSDLAQARTTSIWTPKTPCLTPGITIFCPQCQLWCPLLCDYGRFTPVLKPQDSTTVPYASTSFPRRALELSSVSDREEEGTWPSLGRDLRCPGTQFWFQYQFHSLDKKKPHQQFAHCSLMPFGLFLDVCKKVLHLPLGWYLLHLLLLLVFGLFPVPQQNQRKTLFLLSLAPSKGLRVAAKSWEQLNNTLASCI